MKLIFAIVFITILGLTEGNRFQKLIRGQECPSGWHRILESCIWLSREKKSFDDAHEHCGQLIEHGRLFEPKNRLQNDLVVTLVEMRQLEAQYTWIGITDRLTEGKFKYVSSGKDAFFTKWAIGEPNNGKGGFFRKSDQDCVNFLFKDQSWDDFECSEKLHFICERPLNDLLVF